MKKIVAILVLIFVLLTSTQTAYSYYVQADDIVLRDQNDMFEVEQTLTSSKVLVPTGVVLKENETDTVIYQYEVLVKDEYNLDTELKEIFLINDENISDEIESAFIFNFSFDQTGTTDYTENILGETVELKTIQLTVEVSLNPNMTQEQYNLISGEKLSFNLLLTLTK